MSNRKNKASAVICSSKKHKTPTENHKKHPLRIPVKKSSCVKIGLPISIIIFLFSIISILFSFFRPHDTNIIYNIIIAATSLLSNLVTIYGESDNCKSQKKKTKIDIFSKVAIFTTVISVIFAAAVETTQNENTFENPPDGGSGPLVTEVYVPNVRSPYKYPLEFVTSNKDFDIYFSNSKSQIELYEDLLYTLSNISESQIYSNDFLNANDIYGPNAKAAKEYKNMLEEQISNENSVILNSELIPTLVNELMNSREKMETSCKTPLNRKLYTDDLQYIYQTVYPMINNENILDIQKKCIRYCWGWLYISIATNKYDSDAIDKLIELYTNLGTSDEISEEIIKGQIVTLKDTLEELKAEFQKNEPHSIGVLK